MARFPQRPRRGGVASALAFGALAAVAQAETLVPGARARFAVPADEILVLADE